MPFVVEMCDVDELKKCRLYLFIIIAIYTSENHLSGTSFCCIHVKECMEQMILKILCVIMIYNVPTYLYEFKPDATEYAFVIETVLSVG